MAILVEGELGSQRIFVGLAANLNPEVAAQKALFEAMEVRLGIFDLLETQEVLATPDDINTIHKHAIYYIQQDRTALLDFLLETPNSVELAAFPNCATDDPEQDLQLCLDRCAEAEQPVYVVDITKDDIRPINLHVVRVVMPELQRLTTQHQKPYLGNPRLFTLPVQLGWRDEPLTWQTVNRDPHPFI